jgi:hypothetical protein
VTVAASLRRFRRPTTRPTDAALTTELMSTRR